jgi:5-methylcytosine-specific restriction enzyme B
MVRGTSADGFNLVPQWLAEGHVPLSATQLGNVDPEVSYEDLKQQVKAAYQHKSYAYRGQRLEEFDRFIRRMNEGDLVLHSEALPTGASPDLIARVAAEKRNA